MKPLIAAILMLMVAMPAWADSDRKHVTEAAVKDPGFQRESSDPAEDALQHDAPYEGNDNWENHQEPDPPDAPDETVEDTGD